MPFDYFEYRTVKVTAYSFHLTTPILDAFKHFCSLYLQNGCKPLAKGDIGLPSNIYNNWGFLQHFGVIARDGMKWRLTQKGEDFYRGHIRLLSPCGHFDGKTIEDSSPLWEHYTGPRTWIHITDRPEKALQTHDDYAKEKNAKTSGHVTVPTATAQQSMFPQNMTE